MLDQPIALVAAMQLLSDCGQSVPSAPATRGMGPPVWPYPTAAYTYMVVLVK